MGDTITGREILCGFKKAGTWGTAVACGANDGLLILSEGMAEKREQLEDDSAGLAWVQRSDQGRIEAGGNIEAYMRYDGPDLLLAMIMGAAAAPSQQGETAAYVQAYTLATDIFGIFGTAAFKKKSDVVHEWPAVKPYGFKLSSEMNKPLKLSVDTHADRLVLDTEVNTIAALASLTYRDKGNRILMNSSATFKLNDQSGDALDNDDRVYPSGFELSFQRKQAVDYVAGSEYAAEPDEDGFAEAILTLDFPRYNDANHAFFTDWQAFTKQKGEIYFEGATIADTYKYYLKIEMPNMAVLDPEAAIAGPGKIPAKLRFKLFGCDAAPTGMTGLTLPFRVGMCNTRTTSPLA